MRSHSQATKRYFTAIWLLFAFIIAVISTTLSLIEGPTDDWLILVIITVIAIAAGLIGFVNGITLFVARRHDAEEMRGYGDQDGHR